MSGGGACEVALRLTRRAGRNDAENKQGELRTTVG